MGIELMSELKDFGRFRRALFAMLLVVVVLISASFLYARGNAEDAHRVNIKNDKLIAQMAALTAQATANENAARQRFAVAAQEREEQKQQIAALQRFTALLLSKSTDPTLRAAIAEATKSPTTAFPMPAPTASRRPSSAPAPRPTATRAATAPSRRPSPQPSPRPTVSTVPGPLPTTVGVCLPAPVGCHRVG